MKAVFIFLLMCSMVVFAQEKQAATMSSTPRVKLWQDIQDNFRVPASTLTQNKKSVLYSKQGNDWRNFRESLPKYTALVLGASIAFILLLLLIFGRIKLKVGASGEMVKRFNLIEIINHWMIAIFFMVLGLTGLLMLFGRPYIMPLLGKETMAIILGFSKQIHNIVGLLFIVTLFIILIIFIKDNFYQKGDLKWLFKGGGFGKHVSAWRFNLGEKAWFWLVILAGIMVSITGTFLLFFEERQIMGLSHFLHSIGAILILTGLCGHIYAAILFKGAISGITRGKVDKNWAKEHHDLWYKQVSSTKKDR